MKLSDVFRILRRNILILVFFPSLLAAFVYYKTRDEEKEYSSNFLVYTGFAGGTTITTEEHPRIDHNAVTNAFDNLLTTLKARETVEEVGLRLLVSHLRLQKPNERIISAKNYYNLRSIIPDTIEAKIRNAASTEDALKILYTYRNSTRNNIIKDLLNGGSVYGLNPITSKIVAKRKDFSDMLEVSYSANDPGICQQTLQILSDVVIRRFKEIKQGEISNVVAYFENQTKEAQDKLKAAEENLKNLEVENRIINFDLQTRSISESKQALLNNIEKEKMVYGAAQARIMTLEKKLQLRKGLLETNAKILEKRKLLAELNYKIANEHLYKDKPQELARIKEEADAVKEDIRTIVNDLYQIGNSTEGLPTDNMLKEWLNNVLIADESKARMKIMEAQIKDFDKSYDQYAPLGSTINRMKREIEVAEKEYLAQLNAYNLNKQRQQNIEMASTIRMVDKPFYPTSPKASTRKMLIGGAFFAGFVLIMACLLALAFFDNNIRTPMRAEVLTGLKFCGALPLVRKSEKSYDLEYLESSLMEQAISSIMLEMRHRGGVGPGTKFIMISSPKAEEGKTWCAYKLASKLSEIKGKVLFLYPQSVSEQVSGMSEQRLSEPSLVLKPYLTSRDFVSKEYVIDLVPSEAENLKEYSFILIEIPPLSENLLPIELIKKMDMPLLVVRADRPWTETDTYVTRLYGKACNCSPMLLLNRVPLDGLKEVYGSIPKKKRIKNTGKRVKPSPIVKGKKERIA